MKRLVLVLAFLLVPVVAAAASPSLWWDAVTTGTDGLPLGPGLQVTAYKVYRCGSAAPTCDRTNATVVATVTAPATSFDISAQPTPSVYFVTAVNIVGESANSVTLKVVPPDVPKNPQLK